MKVSDKTKWYDNIGFVEILILFPPMFLYALYLGSAEKVFI